ncbi:MAG TPA: amidohydrolase family protein [Dehalococcoidia bacterium]|nr:amidohydrolase family protein [Dehalococcoidia bacterium]
MAGYQGLLISADSHVVEPADLYVTRIDKKYRDDAPRIESREIGDYIVVKDLQPRPVGFEGAMINEFATDQGVANWRGYRYADNRKGASDPHERLKDQEIDGVSGEVIYTGLGLNFLRSPDSAYALACARVYNDWIMEYVSVAPDRLVATAAIPAHGPVEWAVAEAERAAQLGHRAIMMLDWSPERTWNHPDWDPLWAACQDLGLSVSLHAGGRNPYGYGVGRGAGGINGSAAKIVMNQTVQELIWAGVPQSFPNLQFVLVEGGFGWAAHVVDYMDHWWRHHRRWLQPALEEPPSSYFKRNFWITFEDDRAGILTREMLNVDHLMWGSDYPHTEGIWPRSREVVAKDLAGISEEETRRIVALNCARLYGFKVPATV